jgi:hypothetical protein
MRSFLSAAICTITLALPLTAKEKSSTPPFDADLFRKDVEVFSAHGEFLFWRVQEGCLDYAMTMNQSAWGPSNCYANGNFKSATFGGDPGFRLGLSFFRAPKYWEVRAGYTRLTAEGNNSAHKPSSSTEYLTGTWPQIFTSPVAKAKSHIHMNYNVADLCVDRVFNPNPHLRLRFLGGGLVGWINQDWRITYNDSFNNYTKISNRWKFIGGGLKIGTMVDWYWGRDVYITANSSLGALLGSYKNKAKQTTNFPIDVSYNTSLPVRDAHFSDVRPTFTAQFIFGPSYQKNFTKNRIELFAGYELNVWLNLQEIYRSTSGSGSAAKETWINSSMIALQGLTTRLTIDF